MLDMSVKHRIDVINGPNLNFLKDRNPMFYGFLSLKDIERSCKSLCLTHGIEVVFKQSSYEGQLIDWVHEARMEADGLIINPGGYAHTSIALMDAVELADIPVVEVHLSNIMAREYFRQESYISKVVDGVISGFQGRGYLLGLQFIIDKLHNHKTIN